MQIETASYQLDEGSLCVDAGDASLVQNLTLDLNGQRRISGRQIDIGAYEFDNGLPPETIHIIRVAADGDANKDGSSWDEVTTLSKAVTLSNSFMDESQIWLKEGIYSPATPLVIDDLSIYGGFAGTEDLLEQRNYAQYQSIIDGGEVIQPLRNSLRAGASNTLIDGIVVQNGISPADQNGGAMIIADGALIRNCMFRNNRTQNAKNGAGLHCHSGSLTIENCLFVNNTSSGNGGAFHRYVHY